MNHPSTDRENNLRLLHGECHIDSLYVKHCEGWKFECYLELKASGFGRLVRGPATL